MKTKIFVKMSSLMNACGLNANVRPYVPSKQLLEKIQKENKLEDNKKKLEDVYFDKLEELWWEENKVLLSLN